MILTYLYVSRYVMGFCVLLFLLKTRKLVIFFKEHYHYPSEDI